MVWTCSQNERGTPTESSYKLDTGRLTNDDLEEYYRRVVEILQIK